MIVPSAEISKWNFGAAAQMDEVDDNPVS